MSIERIREALAAGPTPGPWSVETVPTSCGVYHKVGPFPGRRPGYPPRHACLYADYPIQGNPADDELKANAAFIAACNPAAIRELLDRLQKAEAENERLRAERDEHARWRRELANKLHDREAEILVLAGVPVDLEDEDAEAR